jgi:hypothetical protein
MFVSRNSFSGKPLSKLSCVCLPLGKLVNGKHFPVNGKHFLVNGNTFQSTKENLAWFSGKCFPEKFGRKTLSGSCEKFRNVIIC